MPNGAVSTSVSGRIRACRLASSPVNILSRLPLTSKKLNFNMKAIQLLAVIALNIVFSACNERQEVPYDTAIITMIDETDELPTYPTAQVILAPFHLKDNPWQGISIKVVAVTDRDVNRAETVALSKENQYT